MAIDDDQLARLRQAKLTAIVRGRWGDEPREAGSYPAGATLRRGSRSWVLLDRVDPRSAGGPLLWAARHDVTSIDLVIDSDADLVGDVARRFDAFDLDSNVWRIVGTDLVAVEPSPMPEILPPPVGVETLVAVMDAAGLEVVVEQGIVRGEVLGLEVARISDDPQTGHRLDIGVGKFDQVTAAMMYADRPTAEALDVVVAEVRRHRHPGAQPHPVRDLCRERWIRSAVIAEPSLVGATALDAVEATVARENLRDTNPACAVGEGVVVVATHGVDVDVLPVAVDVGARHDPDAAIVIVSTSPALDVVQSLARRAPATVRFVEVEPPWA